MKGNANVGIIVYSFTDHALAVAEKLAQQLSVHGRPVTLVQLGTVTPLKMSDTTAELRSTPSLDAYGAVVFACPVRGGTPAPPMRGYLEGLPTLAGWWTPKM